MSQLYVRQISLFLLLNHVTGWSSWELFCPGKKGSDEIKSFIGQVDEIPMGTPDRALRTVPPWFRVQTSSIPGAGLGVFAVTFIKKHTYIGQFVGVERVLTQHTKFHPVVIDYSWALTKDHEPHRYIDATDPSRSNWLRYVNCARHVSEENVMPSPCMSRTYYRTTRDIAPGTELLTNYGDYFLTRLGIDIMSYNDQRNT